jgi:transcriptional regulator NrdR family protein
VATRIEKKLQENGETEISSRSIGEAVMAELYRLDQVAYVRFASVYREFKDLNQFMSELKGLLDRDPNNAGDRPARPLTVKEGGTSTKASA